MKKKLTIAKTVTVLSLITLCLGIFLLVTARGTVDAKGEYISSLSIASGSDAMAVLEEGGYTALPDPLNYEGESLYLGFTLGNDPITDLVVGYEYRESLEFRNITYYPVSSLSLNEGSVGYEMYLYYTKDKSAGGSILSLTASSFYRLEGVDDDELNLPDALPLSGDGSLPVLDTDGNVANFDLGVGDNVIYLLKTTNRLLCPCISEAAAVTGETMQAALTKAAEKGLGYYYTLSGQNENEVVLIAYDRQDDKDGAVTDVVVSQGDRKREGYTQEGETFSLGGREYVLLVSHDEKAGGALVDFGDMMYEHENGFTLGQWTEKYYSFLPLGNVKNIVLYSDEYKIMKEDKTLLENVSADCPTGDGETKLNLIKIKDINNGEVKESITQESEYETASVTEQEEPVADTAPDTVLLPETDIEDTLSEEESADTDLPDGEEETRFIVTDENKTPAVPGAQEYDIPSDTFASETEEADGEEYTGSMLGGGQTIAVIIIALSFSVLIASVIYIMKRGKAVK